MTAVTVPVEVLLLTRRDAAKMLACGPTKFAKIVARGELTQVRLLPGSDPLYRVDEIRKLVERKTEKADSLVETEGAA